MYRIGMTTTQAAAVGCALLLSACANQTDPPPSMPSPPGEASVTVPTSTAAPGTQIDVRAVGFAASTTVEVGFGPPNSEFSVVSQASTNAAGELNTNITIPESARRGRPYVVVVQERDHEPRAVSDPFVVGSAGDSVSVHGRLTDEGVECPAMRDPAGTLYTLATGDLDWGPGTQVMVRGTIAGMSTCMQGTTISVSSIERH